MEAERYSRQILFDGIGRAGQERLRQSRVLIVGCGALGSSQAEALARAGVGRLRLVDRDFVEISNLQRQTLYAERDAAERLPKAIAAANRIGEINAEVEAEAIVADVNRRNVEALIDGCDVVLDGTDNFSARYLINDACVKHEVDWIYGAAVGAIGATMTIRPGRSACLRCVFEEAPPPASAPTCDTSGVISPIIAMVVAVQITEAMKLLTGQEHLLHNSLMQIDAWKSEWRRIAWREPRGDCPACGENRFDSLADDGGGDAATLLCGRDAVQISLPAPVRIDLTALAERWRVVGEVKVNSYLARLRVGENELTVFQDGRAIVRGTDDFSAARSLYARYVGL